MKNPDPHILQKVRQWVAYGEEDLRFAEHGLKIPDCPCRLVAYHAQQCAEKYLKAYLVFHNVDFPYTHNIARLLELCSPLSDWTDTLKSAEELTPFAVTTRYPGIDEDVSVEETRHAIETARLVRQTVQHALSQKGLQ